MTSLSASAAAAQRCIAGCPSSVARYSPAGPSHATPYVRKRNATGPNIASAIPKPPNSHGPSPADAARHERQISRMRATSSATSAVTGTCRSFARTFMCMVLRSAPNPERISAAMLRARARRARSSGHAPRAAGSSATYSQIASESQTVTSPSISTGTCPDGE